MSARSPRDNYSVSLGTDLFYVAVPIVSGDRVLGVVRLTYPTQVVTDKVRGQLRILWLVAGRVTVALAGAVAFLMATTAHASPAAAAAYYRTACRRIGSMREPQSSGGPEIPQPLRSVNQMADRLEDQLRQQRAFAGDASHQSAHTVDGAARAQRQRRRPRRR